LFLEAYLDNYKLSGIPSGIATDQRELSEAKCRSASSLGFLGHLLLASGVRFAILKQEDLTSWKKTC
jgi:hypothetical protein